MTAPAALRPWRHLRPPASPPHPPRTCSFDVTPPKTTGQRRRPAPALLPPQGGAAPARPPAGGVRAGAGQTAPAHPVSARGPHPAPPAPPWPDPRRRQCRTGGGLLLGAPYDSGEGSVAVGQAETASDRPARGSPPARPGHSPPTDARRTPTGSGCPTRAPPALTASWR